MSSITQMNPRQQSDFSQLIPPHWLLDVREDIQHHEYFAPGKLQGTFKVRSMIVQNDDFKSTAGNTVTVTVESENHGEGVSGETLLSGQEFKPSTNQFTVPIEWYLNAEALSRVADKEAMTREIIAAGPRLARWAGLKRDELVLSEYLSPAGGTNPSILYGGSATQDSELSNTCQLTPDVIDMCKLAIELKAAPLELHDSKTGETLQKYIMIMSNFDRDKLFSNTTWRNAVQSAMERGFQHPLFTGAIGQWNDVLLSVYTQINPGAHRGTPQRPECAAKAGSGDYTNAAGKGYVNVGTDTSINYTKYFPTSGYLEINNSGTIETVEYTSRSNNYFTLSGTLSNTISDGTRITYYKHRSQLIVSGAQSAMRAFKLGDTPKVNSESYGQVRGIGIEFANGTRVVEDSEGNVSNYILCDVWSKTPNFAI